MNPAQQQIQPEDPIQEDIDGGFVECDHAPQVWVVPQGGQPHSRIVEVARRHNPTQAYQLIEGFKAKPLAHGGPIWGHIYLGVILPRQSTGLYEEPAEESARRVIIKKLFKPIVDDDLRRGSRENPYKEVMRMKQLAGVGGEGLVEDAYSNEHVLGCIDALYDDKYLYIITPYCENDSLLHHIPLTPTENTSVEAQARDIYKQMLSNIEYLHQHRICHRDVDPGVSLIVNVFCSCETPTLSYFFFFFHYHVYRTFW
jgi:serine/threonine protein kinase